MSIRSSFSMSLLFTYPIWTKFRGTVFQRIEVSAVLILFQNTPFSYGYKYHWFCRYGAHKIDSFLRLPISLVN